MIQSTAFARCDSHRGCEVGVFFNDFFAAAIKRCRLFLTGPVMDRERVLVVDDEEELLALFSKLLRREGYDVDIAHDGCEAVEKACGNHHGAVIMDIRMPKMGGQEAMARIERVRPGIKFIVISGYPLDAALKRRIDRGEIAYFTKPFDNNEVVKGVKRACRENARRRHE